VSIKSANANATYLTRSKIYGRIQRAYRSRSDGPLRKGTQEKRSGGRGKEKERGRVEKEERGGRTKEERRSRVSTS
jgi:hypothetical protein